MRRPFAFLLLGLLLAACGLGAGPPPGDRSAGGVGGPPPTTVRWAPASEPRAIVLALHGFNDRKAAFDELGPYAAQHGVLVEAYDQPGFGARPDRGRWPGADGLIEEVRARVQALRAAHPGVPVYVLGESMGAAVATAAFGGAAGEAVDGVILSAPAVWGGRALRPLYRRVLTLAALVAPSMKLSGRGLGIQASDNIPALIELGRDPLYIRETRIDAVAGLVGLMDLAREQGPRLTARTLVVTGANDQVVPPQAQSEFVAALPTARCTVATYLAGWHLLLRDLQRERVYRDILAWIEGHDLPSGYGRPCGSARDLPIT